MCTPKIWASLHPADVVGIRTKNATKAARDEFNALTPPLYDQWAKAWYKRLSKYKITSAEINLEMAAELNDKGRVPDAKEWDLYVQAVLVPKPVREKNDMESIVDRQTEAVKNYRFTRQQRAQAIMAFLKRIDKATEDLTIGATQPTFILSNRHWVRGNEQDIHKDAEKISDELALVINAARAECLDHLIGGIHLYETDTYNPKYLMLATLNIATLVNKKTNSWLTHRMMIMGGGGKGAYFKDFKTAAAETQFYKELQPQVETFAWSYNFAENSADRLSMKAWLESSICERGDKCSSENENDWKYFLARETGLDELRETLAMNYKKYRPLTNVIFMGDGSDSVSQMVERADGSLVAQPSYRALSNFFLSADKQSPGAFRGKHFMEFIAATDSNLSLGTHLVAKHGSGEKTRFDEMDNNRELWEAWPFLP